MTPSHDTIIVITELAVIIKKEPSCALDALYAGVEATVFVETTWNDGPSRVHHSPVLLLKNGAPFVGKKLETIPE